MAAARMSGVRARNGIVGQLRSGLRHSRSWLQISGTRRIAGWHDLAESGMAAFPDISKISDVQSERIRALQFARCAPAKAVEWCSEARPPRRRGVSRP